MNFESIEGLSELDVNTLFDDIVYGENDEIAYYQLTICFCKTYYSDTNSKCVVQKAIQNPVCRVAIDDYVVYTDAACRQKCLNNACQFANAAVYRPIFTYSGCTTITGSSLKNMYYDPQHQFYNQVFHAISSSNPFCQSGYWCQYAITGVLNSGDCFRQPLSR